MSTEQNKAIDRRYIDEVLNKGNIDAIDEIMAPSYVSHIAGFPDNDREGDKQLVKAFHSAFTNLRFTIENHIADGDQVMHRLIGRGTHTGEFQGVPASGREIEVEGINISRFVDGKVVEAWGVIDLMSMMQQIGAIPAPSQEAGA